MRFFFDIRSGAAVFEDYEGAEFPGLDAARTEAVRSAREILADKIRRGQPLYDQAIEIRSEEGAVLEVVFFRDQFRIV